MSGPNGTHGQHADHVHRHDVGEVPVEENPIWQQDNVTLHSVGIDVGSAGTQVTFSRLKLRRIGEDLTSRYIVVARDTLFQSPVSLTPYADDDRIDAEALGVVIDRAYHAARQSPDDIDTGVVILTGEALRRENAERIARVIADKGGDFVSATAGHNMEATLAAYGSGAARLSYERSARILNIDIGGGTTKLAVAEHGRVVDTAALHVGGRLQVVDDEGRIVRLDPAGRHHAASASFDWSLGQKVEAADLDRVADVMADAIVRGLASASEVPPDVRGLYLTDPITDLGTIDGVMFSGGVGEFVYGRERRDFGDLGGRLGASIRRRIADSALPGPLLPAGECIRATVLGASQYSVQLSGNTSYMSNPENLLPRRNLQVVRPVYELSESVDSEAVAAAIRSHLSNFDLDGREDQLALSLAFSGPPSYERLSAFARGVQQGLAARLAEHRPVYLVLDGDVALTLGGILHEELGVRSELLVIDSLRLWDFDYVDLGRMRLPSRTVPVTVKSLVFNDTMLPAD